MRAVLKRPGAIALLLLLCVAPAARAADAPLPASSLRQEKAASGRPVRRWISRQEIFQAIQNSLAQKGVAERRELRPSDLIIQSSVPAIQNDVGLQVRRVSFDPLRGDTVFELRAAGEPQFLPFEVSTRPGSRFSRLASRQERPADFRSENGGGHRAKNGGSTKPAVLAKPGQPATLVMLGENLRVTLTVMPLQPGIKGQCILVRDTGTTRVISAEVVDAGLLEVSF